MGNRFVISAAAILLASAGTFAQPAAPVLQVSPNARYLQWSDGKPFFPHACTAWNLTCAYTKNEVVKYLDNRAGLKFNTILLSAVFAPASQADFPPEAFAESDFSRPVAAYWDRVDWVVNQITRRGMVAALNPLWKGRFDGIIARNGVSRCHAFGRWFGNRYRNNPRVIYFAGGDQAPEPTRREIAAMAEGIQEACGGAAIIAYHGRSGQSSRAAFPDASWLTLDWTRAQQNTPEHERRYPYEANWDAWNRPPAERILPIQFAGGRYDGGGPGDRYAVRRQAWWAFLSGAAGHAYSAEALWNRGSGSSQTISWQAALELPGARDMRRFKEFIDAIPWWKLAPDGNRRFLIGGRSQWRTDRYAVAAVAGDQSFAVVYTPVKQSLEIRLAGFGAGNVRAEWLDPCDGAMYPPEQPLSPNADGVVKLTPPDRNSAGDADWVLVIENSRRPR